MDITRSILVTLFFSLLVACSGSDDPSPTDPQEPSDPSNPTEPEPEPEPEPDPDGTTTVDDGSGFIVVDQFGYLPQAQKVAVIHDPLEGFDSHESFTPGETYQVLNLDTGEVVYSASPVAWNEGATHAASGDRAWHFDFSEVSEPGHYQIVDAEQALASYEFQIASDVYRDVLVQAVRSFYYQRAGMAKEERYAELGWVDSASHMGPGQDTEARLYSAPEDESTERDLHGGWYDAGDYNKYTNWHADYLIALLHAYLENPSVWTDDFNIPESGNGIPDLLDEVKWGMDWLIRMQEDDGSVLSVMGLDHASPPSAATGASTYGPASTSATRTSAAAYALGSKVFALLDRPELTAYAEELAERAEVAWHWAEENPDEIFENSGLVAAGEQEVDDYGRTVKRVIAATYLYDLTGDGQYRSVVDNHYESINMMEWDFVFPFQAEIQRTLLYYTTLNGATIEVANDIQNTYVSSINNSDHNWPAIENEADPYRAFLADYTWGSNRTKAHQGSIYYDMISFNIGELNDADLRNTALRYINYLHGVNPLNKVYLSNMGAYGADNSVDSFYHSWFSDGSPDWDSVSESNYGPAPGFLVGGPNPGYSWDDCCPDSCGSSQNNAMCGAEPLAPPAGQPDQKSYADFNTSWPINSWSVTENHNAYQVAYLRLLSKFVSER